MSRTRDQKKQISDVTRAEHQAVLDRLTVLELRVMQLCNTLENTRGELRDAERRQPRPKPVKEEVAHLHEVPREQS